MAEFGSKYVHWQFFQRKSGFNSIQGHIHDVNLAEPVI